MEFVPRLNGIFGIFNDPLELTQSSLQSIKKAHPFRQAITKS